MNMKLHPFSASTSKSAVLAEVLVFLDLKTLALMGLIQLIHYKEHSSLIVSQAT